MKMIVIGGELIGYKWEHMLFYFSHSYSSQKRRLDRIRRIKRYCEENSLKYLSFREDYMRMNEL